jgi:DNA-binding transcriptional LysR family regulator
MKSLQHLRIFVFTMRRKSLSEAARSLSLSPATISRRISALEAELGVQLLDRTSRTLKPTEAGRNFLQHAERVLEALADAEAAVYNTKQEPRGRLRIHSRTQTGLTIIAPLLPKFIEKYPDVVIEYQLSEHPVNLVEQDFDVDFRSGASDDSNFIIKRLVDSDDILVASPAFARAHPEIQHPNDLRHVPCLTYQRDQESTSWWYIDEQGAAKELPIQGAISSNNGEVLRVAAVGGAGVALLFGATCRASLADGSLVRLLPSYRFAVTSFTNGVYAVFRRSQKLPVKVRAFIDYMTEALQGPDRA